MKQNQGFRLTLDEASLRRCKQRTVLRASAIRNSALKTANGFADRVSEAGAGFCAVATGQTQEGFHSIGPVQMGDRMRTGVGMARTQNEQAVKIEAGLLKPHTSLEEHDPQGRKCSSGRAVWEDETETENVREGRGLAVNPMARRSPLAQAVLLVCGPILVFSARFRFRKGAKNVYPGAGLAGGASKVLEAMRAATRAALKMTVWVLLVCGCPPFLPPQAGGDLMAQPWRVGDVAAWQTAFAGTINADTLGTGPLLRVDASTGPPAAYLTLNVHLQGTATVELCGYMICGEDSTHLGPQLTAVNDTVWFLKRDHARADTGWFSVCCDVIGANWARAVLWNTGSAAAVVRARVWMKP